MYISIYLPCIYLFLSICVYIYMYIHGYILTCYTWFRLVFPAVNREWRKGKRQENRPTVGLMVEDAGIQGQKNKFKPPCYGGLYAG